MTDPSASQRNPWARRAIIIFVVIVVLLVAGDIGNNLRTKSPVTKAADATSAWTPSSKNFCTAVAMSNSSAVSSSPAATSSKLLTATEMLSVAAPTKALHTQFSLLAQDYANLLNDPSGLTTVDNYITSSSTSPSSLEKSSDPKVATFAKTETALSNNPFVKSLAKAVDKCGPALTSGDRRQADDATAVASVDEAYYTAESANGPFPITAATVSADIPAGTSETVTSGRAASGAPDFVFTFANGSTVCVSAPQTISANSPALLAC